MKDIFESFSWHSSIGIDHELSGNKTFVTRLPNTRAARGNFLIAGKNLLIHKATQALWRISDDKKSIEPVFDSEVLSEADLKKTGK